MDGGRCSANDSLLGYAKTGHLRRVVGGTARRDGWRGGPGALSIMPVSSPSLSGKVAIPRGTRAQPQRTHAPGLVFLSVALAGLLPLGVPRVHAQDHKERTDEWVSNGGTVEFSPISLTIPEGESRAYRVRLTRPLPTDGNGDQVSGWWVMVRVGGGRSLEGSYDADGDGEDDIRWIPSIGWEFDPSDWPAGQDESHWRDINVTAPQDTDVQDARITFEHEVWDEHTYCPEALHPENLPRITVHVIDDDGDGNGGGAGGNGGGGGGDGGGSDGNGNGGGGGDGGGNGGGGGGDGGNGGDGDDGGGSDGNGNGGGDDDGDGDGDDGADDDAPEPDPEPVPALPLFGALALGAGLLAAGRRHLRERRVTTRAGSPT